MFVRKCAVRLCFSEKMCVRNVLVLLLLCCVNCRAQWDPKSSHGFQDLPEYPGMAPQYGANPGLSNTPGNLNVDQHELELEKWEHIPVNLENPVLSQNGPPLGISGIPDYSQIGPSPGNPDNPVKSPPVILEIPYDPNTDPEYNPFPGNLDPMKHPHHGSHHGNPDYLDHPGPLPEFTDHPPKYAGLPQELKVIPLPMKDSDHELQFNVSWVPSLGVIVNAYTLTIQSVKNTTDCQSLLCFNSFSGNLTWRLIPDSVSSIANTCAIRPGCDYIVNLTSHLWDGPTSKNLLVELAECVVGVCSCAHSPRLPTPVVSTEIVTVNGTMYSNIIWTLPTPSELQRLPSKLRKLSYFVSLGKQTIIKKQWYAIIQKREVDAAGLVSEGDTEKSTLLPLSDKGVPVTTANVLARVNLVDERGCFGPAGNATAFDPDKKNDEQKPTNSKFSFEVYVILGALFGVCAIGVLFVLSARVVKRVLKYFRPAPVSAPLEPLRRRPAWFPLQLRRSGSSSWFADESLKFLLDENKPWDVSDTMDVETSQDHINITGNFQEHYNSEGLASQRELSNSEGQASQRESSNTKRQAQHERNKLRRETDDDMIMRPAFESLKNATNSLNTMNDEFDTYYGMFVANKLRKYTENTKNHVQHMISNILYSADKGEFDYYDTNIYGSSCGYRSAHSTPSNASTSAAAHNPDQQDTKLNASDASLTDLDVMMSQLSEYINS